MISSLMQVEAAPQTRLKAKVSAAQSVVSAYQSVNSKVASLQTAADSLSQLSTWRAVKPTSSSTSVTTTSTGGTDTATGAVKFSVNALATAQAGTMRVNTATVTNAEGKQVAADILPPETTELKIRTGVWVQAVDGQGNPQVDGNGDPVWASQGKEVTVPITDRTAKGVSAAINGAGAGVKATLVKIGETESVLQLNGMRTGADNAFQIIGLDAAASSDGKGVITTTEAANAKITVGDPDNGGFSLVSTTNTFTGLMPGVSVTVSKMENDVTITSVSDAAGIAAKFQALVDAANATLTEIGAQTAYNPETKKGSPLTGDFSVRQMSSAILSTISQGLSFRREGAPPAPTGADATPQALADDRAANVVNFGALSQLGVALDSTGKLTFKADQFIAKYNSDPDAVQAAGIAFADNFEALAKTQTANVTSAVTGRKTLIDSMNFQIDDWDVRLAAKREALQKTYSGLETALSKLNSQSSWLSGQIASLG
jgi:flagellar hook-associated protein 2